MTTDLLYFLSIGQTRDKELKVPKGYFEIKGQ